MRLQCASASLRRCPAIQEASMPSKSNASATDSPPKDLRDMAHGVDSTRRTSALRARGGYAVVRRCVRLDIRELIKRCGIDTVASTAISSGHCSGTSNIGAERQFAVEARRRVFDEWVK